MSFKKCPGCEKELPLAYFSKDKYRSDGLRRKCKGCSSMEFKAYSKTENYKERLERQVEANKKLKQEDPMHRWVRDTFYNVKARAKKLGVEFSLTKEWLKENAPATCPLLDIELVYNADKSVENTASVDRKDSTKGYTVENCKIISFKANRIKSNASVAELQLLVRNMKDY
jgi:hypothetical protein